MVARVLIVDDSSFFRRRVNEILESDARIEVVGMAKNGLEAVEQAEKLKPDVITMDIEMPVMDGITAVRKIMQKSPIPILMFSSLTTDGAKATLDALDAGAVDFLPKKFDDISNDREEAKRLLCARVRLIAARGLGITPVATTVVKQKSSVPASQPRKKNHQLVAIGTSTGGPVALQEVLTKLPKNFPVPIILVQHMPASFTPSFAQRLDGLCQIDVREAVDGDVLKPGLALLAPGGKQMEIVKSGRDFSVKISEPLLGQNYKPSVDVAFDSVARFYPGTALGIVLTGMGADGREGAKKMKQGGSELWSQDEASCVVFGMPAALEEAGLSDYVLPLSTIGETLTRCV